MTLKPTNRRDPIKPRPKTPNVYITTRAYLINNEEFSHALTRLCEEHGKTRTLKQFWRENMPYIVVNLNTPFDIFGTSKSLLSLDIPRIVLWSAATSKDISILMCGGDHEMIDTVNGLMHTHQGKAKLTTVVPTEKGWRVSFIPPQEMKVKICP